MSRVRHFYSLDALRGAAALSIVLFHWPHFFYRGAELGEFTRERLPLYGLLFPFYSQAWRAVDLFFCLSGFIFYWLYAEKIGRGAISAREFFVLRFSRLYPLHLVTLLLMAVAQPVMLRLQGAYFVAGDNDLPNFGVQLLFASGWGLVRGQSFNGPVWSVSIEVLLYALFFLISLWGLRRWWQLAILVVLGQLMFSVNDMVGRGLFSFFLGGLSFYAFTWISRHRLSRVVLAGLIAFCGLMWVAVLYIVRHDALYRLYRGHTWDEAPARAHDAIGQVLHFLTGASFNLFVFPLTIVTLALWEARGQAFTARLAFLGQISYSSYLLHFPLQLLFAAVALACSVPRTCFYSPWSLGLFFGVLIPLSLASYWLLERPAQTFIRTRALGRPAS